MKEILEKFYEDMKAQGASFILIGSTNDSYIQMATGEPVELIKAMLYAMHKEKHVEALMRSSVQCFEEVPNPFESECN